MEPKKRRKRLVLKQESLFRTHQEAGQLLRAADDLMALKATTIKYKAGNYGVKIKDACLTDKLPEEECHIVCDAINSSFQNAAATLCHKAQQINESLIFRISSLAKPKKEQPEDTDIGRCTSCHHLNCPHPKIKAETPNQGCSFWTPNTSYIPQDTDNNGMPQ